ncbi:MAG: PEP-CTERM sorting domain-containing protein [Verrucomicrobiia bacterium]|jgi:hypothetical protein
MKYLRLILLSSSVALACVASSVSAAVTWSSDSATSFALTICGTGPMGGGDFTSPSGQWDFEDSFDVMNVSTSLQLQQCGSSMKFTPTGMTDSLPGYFGFGYVDGDNYEGGNTASGPGCTLPGWSVGSFITYQVADTHNPNTWQWTVECYGSGPELPDWGCKPNWPCQEIVVPEPGSLWLAGVGVCGLAFAHRRGVRRRAQSGADAGPSYRIRRGV